MYPMHREDTYSTESHSQHLPSLLPYEIPKDHVCSSSKKKKGQLPVKWPNPRENANAVQYMSFPSLTLVRLVHGME